jgi:hypothetical protein
MKNLVHDGHVLMNSSGCAPAGPAGTYLRGGLAAQLVQDRGGFVPARSTACTQTVLARPQTLQNNPIMTRSAVSNGASSGPHRARDPV